MLENWSEGKRAGGKIRWWRAGGGWTESRTETQEGKRESEKISVKVCVFGLNHRLAAVPPSGPHSVSVQLDFRLSSERQQATVRNTKLAARFFRVPPSENTFLVETFGLLSSLETDF